jgi:hypothetical protein
MQYLSQLYLPRVLPTAELVFVASGDYTVPATANGTTVVLQDSAAQDVTLQANADADLDVGARIEVYVADDTAAKTDTAPAGVTINGVDGATITITQAVGAAVVLVQTATDTWLVAGGVSA